MSETRTPELLIGFTVAGVVAMVVGMTVPMVVLLGASLIGIVGNQMWHEFKTETGSTLLS